MHEHSVRESGLKVTCEEGCPHASSEFALVPAVAIAIYHNACKFKDRPQNRREVPLRPRLVTVCHAHGVKRRPGSRRSMKYSPGVHINKGHLVIEYGTNIENN
jgi:hypothetical protein